MSGTFAEAVPRPILLRKWRRGGREWAPTLIRRYQFGAIDLLIVFLALQFLIPARLVISGMGSVGRPSVAWGLLLAFLWVVAAFRPLSLPRGAQPIRWALCLFLAVQLVGYATGYGRLLPVIEARSADRWLIYITSMVAVGLTVVDGIKSREQLDRLLKAVIGFASVMAAAGTLQYFRIVDVTRYIQVPGLGRNSDLIGVGVRGDGGFARVAGTATHYIEFGVVLALILPLALHYAFHAPRGRRVLQWALVGLIAGSIPFSISRAAIVTVAVTTVLMFAVWKWRIRYNAIVLGVVAGGIFHVINRGLLGTIKSLFSNVDNDPSIQGRLGDQAYVMAMFAERPLLGRGAGTVMPSRYILLDNQFFGMLLAGGLLGIFGFVALFAAAYMVARSIRLRAPHEESRHLGQALAAGTAGAFVASGTFDSLAFPTFTGVLFILVGATGALWRLDQVRPTHSMQGAATDRFMGKPLMADVREPVSQTERR